MSGKWLFIAIIFYLRCFFVSTLECYSCDSVENVDCAIRPGQQLHVELCQQTGDVCITNIVEGQTRRGCLSRLYPNKYCPEPCDRCNQSLCNRHIFPAERLRCYQCSGADCIDVSNRHSYLLPCPKYNAKDRCYTNIRSVNLVQRGCEFTNLTRECDNVCLKCNYDACNKELGVYHQSCLQCQHMPVSPNPDCIREQNVLDKCSTKIGTKRCTNKLMYGHVGKCFTYINNQTGVVERGCSTTMGFYPTGNVTECYGENCNDNCLTISCKVCNSTTATDNDQCRSGKSLKAQTCEAGTISCYTCETATQLRRGCMDSHFQQHANESCHLCRNADGCNVAPARTCYHCSSLVDADCEKLTQNAKNLQHKCNSTELCVSTVVKKLNLEYVVRGCNTQVTECTPSDPFCVRCNGSLCNNIPIQLHKTVAQPTPLNGEQIIVQKNGTQQQTEQQLQRNGQMQRYKFDVVFLLNIFISIFMLTCNLSF